MRNVLTEERVLNLDKSNWELTKLESLAKEISKRVENPNESEYDRFVGLGNFVSGNIKIKTWETTENLTSSAKAFKSGDILFARRNAYLRRASLVDFDGCCSGDAFVLRENRERVVPGFLAFLMNSNSLWDYANAHAAGTMSKRVKWRDLAEYGILLPPKEQQAQLIDLLQRITHVVEKEEVLIKRSLDLMNSIIKEKITALFYKNDQEFLTLKEVCEVKGRVGWKGYKKSDLRNSGPIVIGAKDIDSLNRLSLTNPTYLSKEKFEESPEIMVTKGDILIVQRGNTIGKLVHILDEVEEVTINPSMVLMKNIKIDSNFLFAVLISPHVQKMVESISSTTAIPMITQKDIKEFKIPNLSSHKMENIGTSISEVRSLIKELEGKLLLTKSVQKNLINQIF